MNVGRGAKKQTKVELVGQTVIRAVSVFFVCRHQKSHPHTVLYVIGIPTLLVLYVHRSCRRAIFDTSRARQPNLQIFDVTGHKREALAAYD